MNGRPVHVHLAGSAHPRQIQRHGHRQPLVIRRHHRQEHGCVRQARVTHHLGQMLVGEPQRVGARSQQLASLFHRHLGLGSRASFRKQSTAPIVGHPQCRQRCPVLGNHLLAAPRIAGVRGSRQRMLDRQQPGIHQRPHGQDEGRGVAAGVGNALAVADALALVCVQLGQAVGPGRVHPVGRAGVDDAGGGVVDQGHRFAGSCVGQAQEGNISRVQQSRPLGRVLAQRRVDAQHRDIAAPAQILVDLQTGRSFLSIYKDLVNTHLFIIPGSCHAARRRPEARDLLAPAQGDARCMAPCTSCPGFQAGVSPRPM